MTKRPRNPINAAIIADDNHLIDLWLRNMKKKHTGETIYSEEITGDRRNWDWPVDFDFTGGYVGITQTVGNGIETERVLLTPRQFDELVKFVERQRGDEAGQGEWQFCEIDDKCYLRAGHGGECEKTKERRRDYTRQAQEGGAE